MGSEPFSPDVAPRRFRVDPATAARWADFETLMGAERGGAGGCWCMMWRLPRKAFDAMDKTGRKAAMSGHFAGEVAPGLLAYDGEAPVGWCAVAPREAYPRLAASRVAKAVDTLPVWSVTCFYVAANYRRKGVSLALLHGACQFVADQGGETLEGYPIAPPRASYPAVYAWVGLESVFKTAGFQEVARRTPTRPVMRKHLSA